MQLGTLENPEKMKDSDTLPQLFVEPYEIELGDEYYWEQNGHLYVHIMELIDIDAVKAGYSVLLREDEEIHLPSS